MSSKKLSFDVPKASAFDHLAEASWPHAPSPGRRIDSCRSFVCRPSLALPGFNARRLQVRHLAGMWRSATLL